MGALLNMTQTQTAGNLYASGWGMNTNVAGMSSDAMMQTAENVMSVSPKQLFAVARTDSNV